MRLDTYIHIKDLAQSQHSLFSLFCKSMLVHQN